MTTVTWQQHLERCAQLNIAPKVMTETEWAGEQGRSKRPPHVLTDTQREALLKECYEAGRKIAGMKLLPETLAAMKEQDRMRNVLTENTTG